MSSDNAIVDPPPGTSTTATVADDPYLIEVVAPIESETKDATLAEIRGDVPADRATLEGLSDAMDAQAVDLQTYARRAARRAALTLG